MYLRSHARKVTSQPDEMEDMAALIQYLQQKDELREQEAEQRRLENERRRAEEAEARRQEFAAFYNSTFPITISQRHTATYTE